MATSNTTALTGSVATNSANTLIVTLPYPADLALLTTVDSANASNITSFYVNGDSANPQPCVGGAGSVPVTAPGNVKTIALYTTNVTGQTYAITIPKPGVN